MKNIRFLKKSLCIFLTASLGLLLFSAMVLRADVTLTDRQAVEKEAKKKLSKSEKLLARAQKTAARINHVMPTATGAHALIDNSGLEWFINSDITFITSSSASGAASEASYTHAVTATTSAGGITTTTLSDMFDGYNALAISFDGSTGPVSTVDPSYHIFNDNGVGSTECSGRQVVLNAQVIDNIRVQRKIFVPSNDSFCRWLNIFTNQDTVNRTFNIMPSNNLGSDSNNIIVATSDGDALPELSDHWVTTMQNYTGSTSPDPRIGHVLKGPGAPVGLAAINFANGDDNPHWAYTLTLAPGETAIIMNFAVGQPSKAQAAAKCAELITLPANVLACMTPAEVSQVRNFAVGNHAVVFLAGANGSVSGDTNQTVADGGDAAPVLAVADPGYIFVDWTGNNGFYASDNPLTVYNVKMDMTITANFANLPPVVVILTPANGATVRGTVDVQVDASDLDGIALVKLDVGGQQIAALQPRITGIAGKAAAGSSLYSFNWDTTLFANGQHALQATAFDKAGFSASVSHTVTIDNAILSLQASRLQERTWTMVRDYAHLTIGLSHGTAATAKYAIMRKEASGPYATAKEISLAELASGNFTWNDGYLKKSVVYTYRVLALDSA
ncbi:MAG TPA: Ig-like domain-containing protein, partial [Candidatus Binatia bacterium]|nr:Ig-like domain-containing protein [Candidatus Binatia bacterium]